MKASISLRWKDQGFQTGAGVIFPMALLVCLVHWTESVTMTVIADFRLWWHPHWPHVLPLLISLPLHFFHIFLLPCFSAPARLFLARSLRLGWKHVGKYHSRIHRSRKSWSNKSFESLLQHVSKPDSPNVSRQNVAKWSNAFKEAPFWKVVRSNGHCPFFWGWAGDGGSGCKRLPGCFGALFVHVPNFQRQCMINALCPRTPSRPRLSPLKLQLLNFEINESLLQRWCKSAILCFSSSSSSIRVLGDAN